MFNALESVANSENPVTPVLGCRISKALEPRYVLDDVSELHLGKYITLTLLSSSSSCARSIADIGYHGPPILSVVSSPDELIVWRFFPCY